MYINWYQLQHIKKFINFKVNVEFNKLIMLLENSFPIKDFKQLQYVQSRINLRTNAFLNVTTAIKRFNNAIQTILI